MSMPAWIEKIKLPQDEPLSWLRAYQAKQHDLFLQQGIPSRQHERFKYTDFSCFSSHEFKQGNIIHDAKIIEAVNKQFPTEKHQARIVFIDGYFSDACSDITMLAANVIASTIKEAPAELIKKHWPTQTNSTFYPFANLNTGSFTDGLFLYVPDQLHVETPIHVLSVSTGLCAGFQQHVIVLGKHSQVVMCEEFVSLSDEPSYLNSMQTIKMGDCAKLSLHQLQNQSTQAIHMTNTFVHQLQNSVLNYVNFSRGARFSRDDVAIFLEEKGAECSTAGFSRLKHDDQYIDHHVDIYHLAPNSRSEMLYKSVLDKKSRFVFNGRLYVEKDAQKIMAYQANHNILLSNTAEVYSKPELEIYADDVKCKHGATTGQMDEDALFYLRARGIPIDAARNMLLRGFADEVIQRATLDGVKIRAKEWVQ